MSKQLVLGFATIFFLMIVALANFAGVGMSAMVHFLCPASIVMTLTIGTFLYFYEEDFSAAGVVGILIVGFGFLWFMSRELWESWARGGDMAWRSLSGLSALKAILPEPPAIHPFVFAQSFIVLWSAVGIGLILYGGYLMYRGYIPFAHPTVKRDLLKHKASFDPKW